MESGVAVKLFKIIESLGAAGEPIGLAPLAARVALTKSTVHRILSDLVALGYVERVRPGVYTLTNKLQRVITGKDDQRLMSCAEPLLWELHAETDETVNLGVLSEDRVIYLKVIESAQPLRRVAEVNSTDPFYNTALGRAIVSQLPLDEREAVVGRANLVPRTDKTVGDKQRLREILDAARRDGFAYEQDESDMGVTCLGVPVFENSRVVAAMSVSVPTVRMDDKRFASIVDLLKSAAMRLSDMLSLQSHG